MFLPRPLLWHIGPFRLTSHGLFFALGAEAAGLLLAMRAQRRGLDPGLAWPLLAWTFAAGLAGARLAFLILYPDAAGGWSHLLDIWQGGLVSYGGLAAGSLATAWYVHAHAPAAKAAWYDAAVLATLLAWGIGRIGNFLAGDSIGTASGFWQVFYGRVPIQLLESLLCFVLCAWLWRRNWSDGRVALIGGIGYFAGRLVIDTWRDENLFIGLHVSQWASLGTLLFLLFYARVRR